MKTIYVRCALAAAAAAFATGANAQVRVASAPDLNESPIYVRTDGLPGAVARRVEEEAQKGLRPLRQYVQRTKYIHQIDLVSLLMTREQARVAVTDDGTVKLVQMARR